MKISSIKPVHIEPKDFSNRKHFPGTPGHPYHIIDKIQGTLSKVPFPVFGLLLGGLIYLITNELSKALILAGFFLLDWLMLRLLPICHISFGPPTLTAITLGIMRAPFLAFRLPTALAFQGVGTLLVVYAFYIEPQFPRVVHYQVRLLNHPLRSQIRIVHLSDLHMEFITCREVRAMDQINALKPDLILYTGDFFNLSYQDHPKSHKDINQFFQRLTSHHGVYAVTGSPSVDLEKSLAKISIGNNLNLLRDQIVDLVIRGQPIQLIGLDCTHQPGKDIQRLKELLEDRDSRTPKARILLYHSPDLAPHLGTLPIDLQVSGHTHGGQVQIPFIGPIYSGSLYGHAFSSGHYHVNLRHQLIISRGLGLEGEAAPRVRFFSPPEISHITLEFTGHHVQ